MEFNKSNVGVESDQVMTVLGPIPVEDLGITLVHEHTLIDSRVNGPEPEEASRKHLFHRPLTMEILGEVRALPQSNRDNQRLGDVTLAAEELQKYAFLGGRTIIEPTVEGIGRDPVGVQHVSRGSGVNIILGAGYYIGLAHPPQASGYVGGRYRRRSSPRPHGWHPRDRCPSRRYRRNRHRQGLHG